MPRVYDGPVERSRELRQRPWFAILGQVDGSWSDAVGVIEMPDGTRLRGRGLRRPMPAGEQPSFGLYLLGRRPPEMPWPSAWLEWPDFRLPRRPGDAVVALIDAHRRAALGRVELACNGGRGRTGTALACIAILAGVPADDAVEYVRAGYDRHAVETPFQRRFVRRFPESVSSST